MPNDELMEVVSRALKDEEFFKALSKDPALAARNAGITLSEADEEKLREAMAGKSTVSLDLPRFLQEAHQNLEKQGLAFRWVSFSWVEPFRYRDR